MPKIKFAEISSFLPDKVAVIDTETTGLGEDNNEVLSLSIVDIYGATLFDHLIKPQKRKRWPKAQEIHGISPADVANEKTLLEYEDELRQFFDGSYLIVGYNIKFDIGMLNASGFNIQGVKTFDVMTESQKVNGRRVKLIECAQLFGYGDFAAHGSLEDAKATAYCFKRLVEDDGYRRICELESAGASRQSAQIIAAQEQPNSQSSSSGCGIIAGVLLVIVILILVGFFACTAVLG